MLLKTDWNDRKEINMCQMVSSGESGNILFYNVGNGHGFAFCKRCGRAAVEFSDINSKDTIPYAVRPGHKRLWGEDCEANDKDIARHVVFTGNHPTFPEMEVFNLGVMAPHKTYAEYLEKEGIPILIGQNPNLEATFELYFPIISKSPLHMPSNFGSAALTEIGMLYQLQHDVSHHFAGIPGLRRSDLQDLEATRKKFIDIMLLKEVYAGANSSMIYIANYWKWRDKDKIKNLSEYEKYANGFYSAAKNLTRADHVNLVRYSVYGNIGDYYRTLKKVISPSSIMETREQGIPTIIDLKKIFGKNIEPYIAATLGTYVEPIYAYFRKNGFTGFTDYCKKQAEYSLSKWHIEWSDDFQIGIPLDQLKVRVENLLEQISVSNNIVDPTSNMSSDNPSLGWEGAFLKSEISLFARKIREAQEVNSTNPNFVEFNKILNHHYNLALKMHIQLRSKEIDAATAKTQFQRLVKSLETQAPVDKVISLTQRLAGINYKYFWRDPFARVVQTELPPNWLSPVMVEGVLNNKIKYAGTGKEARKFLAQKYQESIKQRLDERVLAVQQTPVENNPLLTYQTTITDLLVESFLPQIPEINITQMAKEKIVTGVNRLINELNALQVHRENADKLNTIYRQVEQTVQQIYLLVNASQNGKKSYIINSNAATLIKTLDKTNNIVTMLDLEVPAPYALNYVYTSPPINNKSRPGEVVYLNDTRDKKLILAPVTSYQSVADWMQSCNYMY